VLATALARLRACGDDAISILFMLDQLPDVVLPHLAYEAARRPGIHSAKAMCILIKAAGPRMLERALGKQHCRFLLQRYPGWRESLSAGQ
jgi:hypothetical protein